MAERILQVLLELFIRMDLKLMTIQDCNWNLFLDMVQLLFFHQLMWIFHQNQDSVQVLPMVLVFLILSFMPLTILDYSYNLFLDMEQLLFFRQLM